MDADDEMIDKVISLLEAEIPEAMFNNKLEDSIKEFAYKLQSQGMGLEAYMKYTGMDLDKLKNQFRPQAEKQVKLRLALDKIAEKENLKPTEQEIEEKYKQLSEQYKMDTEKIRNIIIEKDLIKDIAAEKAVDFLRENCIK